MPVGSLDPMERYSRRGGACLHPCPSGEDKLRPYAQGSQGFEIFGVHPADGGMHALTWSMHSKEGDPYGSPAGIKIFVVARFIERLLKPPNKLGNYKNNRTQLIKGIHYGF